MRAAVKEEMLGTVICAWCGEDLGAKAGIDGVSHGICEPCKIKVLGEKPITMNMLCYREGELEAIQPTNGLSNFALKEAIEVQRKFGRDIAYELVW